MFQSFLKKEIPPFDTFVVGQNMRGKTDFDSVLDYLEKLPKEDLSFKLETETGCVAHASVSKTFEIDEKRRCIRVGELGALRSCTSLAFELGSEELVFHFRCDGAYFSNEAILRISRSAEK